jgi:hypothetical protein
MFDFIKDKLNEEIDVFRGGYAFWFDYNGFHIVKVDNEKLTVEDFEYTPIAMPNEQETVFTERNNRSDYTRIFQFLIRVRDINTPVTESAEYQALLALKDKLHLQVYTVDGIKVKFKCSKPMSRGTYTHESFFWAMFDIQISSTEIETGFFSDEATIEIRKQGGAWQEIDWLEVALPTGAQSVPVVNVFTNDPPKEKISRYTTQPNITFNYTDTVLERELYNYQMGKGNPTQLYELRITESWGTYSYVIKFINGAPIYRRGSVTRVSLEAKVA